MSIRIKSLDGLYKEIKEKRIRVKELLKKAGLSSEAYIVVRDGNVLTEEDLIYDGDTITLYPVISGG
jgi:sulfur carrier protein